MSRRRGLRRRLVSLSVLVMAVYFVVVCLINSVFLDNLYLRRTQRQLTEAYAVVAQNPEGDREALSKIEQQNMRVTIVDPGSEQVIYSSYGLRSGDPFTWAITQMVMMDVLIGLQNTDGDYFIEQSGSRQLQGEDEEISTGDRLVLGGRAGRYLVEITAQLEPLQQSARLATRFMLQVGILVTIAAALAFAKTATDIVKPVEEMTETAQKIADLDFSRKCRAQSSDEIGALALSINAMSDRLQEYTARLEQANVQLKTDLMELEKAEQNRKSLVSNLSHDLKTPIALISGYADGLRSGMAKTPEQMREYCDIISDESERMLAMIQRMLQLSRLESGAVELQPESFDAAAMLEEILSHFQVEIQRQGIALETAFAEELPVVADYVSVQQVLTNFIQNAVSHVDGRKQMRVAAADAGQQIRIAVWNTALPFSDEEKQSIWNSFYRGEQSRKRSGSESGLGLAIVKGNLELMQLPYGVENRDGGVEFWFCLPKE